MGGERLAKRANPFVRAVARPHRELAKRARENLLEAISRPDHRRSPIEKATSPLKLILYFADLDETARQMDMLQRALEEARPIANDESLDEEQKRVNLRKTLKAATSAIWASHHSGGKRQHGVP